MWDRYLIITFMCARVNVWGCEASQVGNDTWTRDPDSAVRIGLDVLVLCSPNLDWVPYVLLQK